MLPNKFPKLTIFILLRKLQLIEKSIKLKLKHKLNHPERALLVKSSYHCYCGFPTRRFVKCRDCGKEHQYQPGNSPLQIFFKFLHIISCCCTSRFIQYIVKLLCLDQAHQKRFRFRIVFTRFRGLLQNCGPRLDHK